MKNLPCAEDGAADADDGGAFGLAIGIIAFCLLAALTLLFILK